MVVFHRAVIEAQRKREKEGEMAAVIVVLGVTAAAFFSWWR